VTRGRKALGAVLAVLALLVGGYLTQTGDEGRSPTTIERVEQLGQVDAETGLTWVELGTLPAEVAQTVARIDRGGPFRYTQDGATFGNRERLLPSQPSGFYREYTVPTPGSRERGARRVVAGDEGRQLFYTGDHYASFVRIRR
jgi:ribonuclease T1